MKASRRLFIVFDSSDDFLRTGGAEFASWLVNVTSGLFGTADGGKIGAVVCCCDVSAISENFLLRTLTATGGGVSIDELVDDDVVVDVVVDVATAATFSKTLRASKLTLLLLTTFSGDS